MGKTKGKEKAGTSSDPGTQSKRPRVEEEVHYIKPDWTSGPLSNHDRMWQSQLFKDKMNTLRDKREAFVCEKEVRDKGFEPFGVFENLGR